jgi:pimeloyl-ACP methyl ester carboxylesterase
MEVPVRGIPVHFEQVGEGRPVLVLHGFGTDHRFSVARYEPLFAARDGWRRIYPDLPGMGRTPGASWITGPDEMLDVVLGFIDAVLPVERFAVIGISWGGYMALGVARHLADRLDGLMLTAPVVRGDMRERELPPRVVLRRDPRIDDLLEPGELPWTNLAVIQTPETLAAFREAVKPGLLVADRAFLGGLRPRFSPEVVEDRLPAPLEAPVLVLTGRHDVATGYRDAWPLLADMPRATYAVLDGAGHGVEEEQAGLFRALAGDWLDRVEGWVPPG